MFFRNKGAAVSWIVVFLGNPGARYENTRHNAGFMTADVIEKSVGVSINRIKFNSLTGTVSIGGQRVFLMKPQTYMNLSGGALRQAMHFYRVSLGNVLVISDDISMPMGKLRIRRNGSAGGHNGLKDIIEKCGGDEFPRIKIGVGGPPDEGRDMADWVLSKLSGEEKKLITGAAVRAAEALKLIIAGGIDAAMGEYN